MTPLLEALDVDLGIRLKPTRLTVTEGSFIALIGPNGSGKTSLLRAIAGVEQPSGLVAIDGERLWAAPPARRRQLLSFLPASRDVAWPISVRDVIALGLSAPDSERVEELIEMLELAPLANRSVSMLSTGERARALLARALAPRPRLLLLDEPLSNLDPYWVLRTVDLLRSEVRARRCSAIVSVHDLAQSEKFERALLMRGGRLIADLPPQAMLRSRELSEAFGIVREGQSWRISQPAGRQSSP